MNFYKENCSEINNKIFLFGNKIERSVDVEEIDDFCVRNILVYYETRAKDGKNINDVFKKAGIKLIENVNEIDGKIFQNEKKNNENLMYKIINNENDEKIFNCC